MAREIASRTSSKFGSCAGGGGGGSGNCQGCGGGTLSPMHRVRGPISLAVSLYLRTTITRQSINTEHPRRLLELESSCKLEIPPRICKPGAAPQPAAAAAFPSDINRCALCHDISMVLVVASFWYYSNMIVAYQAAANASSNAVESSANS